MLYIHTGLQLLYWTHCAHALSILHICIEYEHLQTLGKRSCSFPLFYERHKTRPRHILLKAVESRTEHASQDPPAARVSSIQIWVQFSMSAERNVAAEEQDNVIGLHKSSSNTKPFRCAFCSWRKLFLRKLSHSLAVHVLPSSQRDERQKVTNMNVLLEETASLWQEITAICEPLHGTHNVMTQRKFN